MSLPDVDRAFWEQVAARWCGGGPAVSLQALDDAAEQDTARVAQELEQHQTRRAIPTALEELTRGDDDDPDDDW